MQRWKEEIPQKGGGVSKLITPGKTGALRRTREAHMVPPGIGKAEENGRHGVRVGVPEGWVG